MPSCRYCGGEISNEFRFCPNCGEEVIPRSHGQPLKLIRKKRPKENNSRDLQSAPWAVPVYEYPQPTSHHAPNFYPVQYQPPYPYAYPYPHIDPKMQKAKDYATYGIIAGVVGLFVFGFVLGAVAFHFGAVAYKLDRSQGVPAMILGVIDIIAALFVLILLFQSPCLRGL